MQSAEIHFWRLVNPLMNKSVGVRKMVRALYSAARPVARTSDHLLESSLDVIFLAIVIFIGCAAFGCGYLIGLWLG